MKVIILTILLCLIGMIYGIAISISVDRIIDLEREKDFWREQSNRNLKQLGECLDENYKLTN